MQTDAQSRQSGGNPWIVVILGFATLAFSFSVRGSLSLAMPLWQVDFGWSRSTISAIAAMAMIVMALVAPFAGGLADRYGARGLLAAGLGAIGIGMALVTMAVPGVSAYLLPVGFAGIAAIGFGSIAQHVVSAAVAQRFDENRGLATGIATSGSTAGQLALMPLLAALMAGGDWQRPFMMLAIGCFILVPVTLLLLRRPARPAPARRNAVETATASHSLGRRIANLFLNPVFHALLWSFAICGFTSTGVIETHLMPYASACGFGPIPSATAYGILSGVNLIGMITAGYLADRMHRPLLLAIIYLMRALSFVLLIYISDNYALLLIFSVMFGFFDYSTVPVLASYVASRLGVGMLGLVMGLLSAGHALGAAAGAWAGGLFFDSYGSYTAVWLMALAFALLAAAMVAGLKDRDEDGYSQSDSDDLVPAAG
ncbi:MFS transporter [Martelella alba]|uniref:MFS transporter n=1 Tax=Martelella alba TaxID=2590451 RepID=A0A506UBM6_9HYPH|nr:MFS transporter [Martelella alba]TPW29197.1 MFS transporter [Martelella alba]